MNKNQKNLKIQTLFLITTGLFFFILNILTLWCFTSNFKNIISKSFNIIDFKWFVTGYIFYQLFVNFLIFFMIISQRLNYLGDKNKNKESLAMNKYKLGIKMEIYFIRVIAIVFLFLCILTIYYFYSNFQDITSDVSSINNLKWFVIIFIFFQFLTNLWIFIIIFLHNLDIIENRKSKLDIK